MEDMVRVAGAVVVAVQVRNPELLVDVVARVDLQEQGDLAAVLLFFMLVDYSCLTVI
jgi:hypothetical protein